MNALDAQIYAKLTGASALTALVGGTAGVLNTVAPRGRALPVCLFSMQSGLEENLTQRRSLRMVYLIKGVARSKLVAGQVSDAAIEALRDVELDVQDWGWFWSAPVTGVSYAEPDPAQVSEFIYHVGWDHVFRVAK